MRSIWDEIAREIEELRALVDSITPVSKVLQDHADSAVTKYLRIRRRFDHAAFVVALYAAFEKFVESLVSAYAQLMASRTAYAALPQNLRSKHLNRSAEILARGRLGEGRYAGLTAHGLVKNLFDCLSASNPYTLNEIAITHHDQNLRVKQVDALFSVLDINKVLGIEQATQVVCKADTMLRWFNDVEGSESVEVVPSETIEQRLKGVVERRNEVAHRGGNPDNLLGVADMREVSDFMHAYTRSLFEVAVTAYLKQHWVDSGQAIRLDSLEDPLKGGRVLIVARPAALVQVQQAAFMLREGRTARWGRVQEIQIDNHSVQSVDTDSTASELGLKFDFPCTRKGKLYLLPQADDNIWEPTHG